MNMEMPKKDPNQLELDLDQTEEQEFEQEKSAVIKTLKDAFSDFNPNDLVFKDGGWRVKRLGADWTIQDYIEEKRKDDLFHSKDREKGDYLKGQY